MVNPVYVRCAAAGGEVWRATTGPLQRIESAEDLARWRVVDTIALGHAPTVYEIDATTLAMMQRVFADRRPWWRRALDRRARRCRVDEEGGGLFIGRRYCSTHGRRWDGGGPCPAAGEPRRDAGR